MTKGIHHAGCNCMQGRFPCDGVAPVVDSVPAGIREIRLHFYKAALQCRHYAQSMTLPTGRKHYNAMADKHMSRVQALNEIFPADDMVDADYHRSLENGKKA